MYDDEDPIFLDVMTFRWKVCDGCREPGTTSPWASFPRGDVVEHLCFGCLVRHPSFQGLPHQQQDRLSTQYAEAMVQYDRARRAKNYRGQQGIPQPPLPEAIFIHTQPERERLEDVVAEINERQFKQQPLPEIDLDISWLSRMVNSLSPRTKTILRKMRGPNQ